MADKTEFDNICPYNDEEAVKALGKVANHPAVFAISEYLFVDYCQKCILYGRPRLPDFVQEHHVC